MDLFDLFAKITLDTSEYERDLDDAGKKTTSFASKLKKGLASAGKVAAVGLGVAATAVAALSKAAISSYAEYEQLVGGVETLFKDSSDAVMEYANNAYRTAGLSANQYMSTVTSFSASLLQSLAGDTEAAAEMADMAITDMADNANKMGTDMTMIQNAYQGFAKQNYTMLDNLKLGYGGTKTEMERLLEDAEQLSGIEYDISSYADIVAAIHVVQTEMGITGTTAAEASETIQGSVSAMRSAWTNFLTGMADGNQDADTLIGNLVDSVVTVGRNIIPRIQTLLPRLTTGLATLIQSLLPYIPTILGALLPALIDGATGLIGGFTDVLPSIIEAAVAALPQLAGAAVTIIAKLISALTGAAPQLLEAGFLLLDQLTAGIESGLPDMLGRLPQIITDFINFFTENLPTVLEKGAGILMALIDGIVEAIPDLVAALPQVIAAFVGFFVTMFPTILRSGGELLGRLIMGILGAIPEIALQLPGVLAAIVDALKAGWEELKDAGGYLLEGLWSGITDKIQWLKGKVTGVIDTIKGWFTGGDGFDEHSPSRWSRQVFRRVMEGGSEGVDEGMPALMRDIRGATDRVKSGLEVEADPLGLSANGSGTATSSGGGYPQSDTPPQPLIIQIGDEVLAEVIVDVVRREVRMA